ncbi:MAG: radical SAM protein [Archaeoglobaceae archaeon]
MKFKAGYLNLSKEELEKRVETLYSILESCELCPRKCNVNRLEGETGECGAEKDLKIASYHPHFGEEDPLVGSKGSGTIFLSNCNLRCVYCQNYDISHLGAGKDLSSQTAAKMMMELQNMGCHNINLVTPTQYTPHLVDAIKIAANMGLEIPIVWNCGGYENVETIRLLDGIVDIYMPDFKYSSSEPATKYSDAPDYFERCKEAIEEMFRQVGDLKTENGIAYRGLLVRHLVLPNGMAGSEEILKFLSKLSKNTYVNVMAQYRPAGEAYKFEELSRRPTGEEFFQVVELAEELGLTRGLEQRYWLI